MREKVRERDRERENVTFIRECNLNRRHAAKNHFRTIYQALSSAREKNIDVMYTRSQKDECLLNEYMVCYNMRYPYFLIDTF